MEKIGHNFKSNDKHGELLRNLQELGGIDFCPDDIMYKIIKWLILCYVGERGYGPWGNYRKVFYSNIGAPISMEILKETYKNIYNILVELREKDREVKAACAASEYVERRFQEILDNIEK